jgi:hypothetical protein
LIPFHRSVSAPDSAATAIKREHVGTEEEEEEEEEEETPRSTVPGKAHTCDLKRETPRIPRTDSNINADFGYALMLQAKFSAFSLSIPMQAN